MIKKLYMVTVTVKGHYTRGQLVQSSATVCTLVGFTGPEGRTCLCIDEDEMAIPANAVSCIDGVDVESPFTGKFIFESRGMKITGDNIRLLKLRPTGPELHLIPLVKFLDDLGVTLQAFNAETNENEGHPADEIWDRMFRLDWESRTWSEMTTRTS